MTKPCKRCPFRTDVKPYLTTPRVEGILDTITHQQGTFTCHNTVKSDDYDDQNVTDEEQHCAGALILLEHIEKPNQMMRIMERFGGYDAAKLDMDSPVYKHPDEMLEAFEIENTQKKKASE